MAEINSDLIRGHIDAIILAVLLEGDNYGYEIIKMIEQKSHGVYILKEPSLYTSLKRLEKQGCVESYWGDESQGGRRKYYMITESGRLVYITAVNEWQVAKEIISRLLEKGENHE